MTFHDKVSTLTQVIDTTNCFTFDFYFFFDLDINKR